MKPWVIVASATRARVFESAGRHEPWTEIWDLVNAENRLHGRDIGADEPGRAVDKTGGQRHAIETTSDPKEQLAIRFARDVVERLTGDFNRNRFGALDIVAPPQFLGMLRKQMNGSALTGAVRGEIAKDLTREEMPALQEHVAALR